MCFAAVNSRSCRVRNVEVAHSIPFPIPLHDALRHPTFLILNSNPPIILPLLRRKCCEIQQEIPRKSVRSPTNSTRYGLRYSSFTHELSSSICPLWGRRHQTRRALGSCRFSGESIVRSLFAKHLPGLGFKPCSLMTFRLYICLRGSSTVRSQAK